MNKAEADRITFDNYMIFYGNEDPDKYSNKALLKTIQSLLERVESLEIILDTRV